MLCFAQIIYRSERGKKGKKRTEYGVTEKGGAFDKLKYFSGNK